MTIENDEQLRSVLLKEMKDAINEIADKIASDLDTSIRKEVYGRAESVNYTRTKDFLNSIIQPTVEVSGSEVSVVVGLDYTKLRPELNDDSFFNSHMSVNGSTNWAETGVSVSEGLLAGFDIGTKNSKIHNITATTYWYDVFGDHASDNPNYKKLDDLIDKIVTKHLKKFGITY